MATYICRWSIGDKVVIDGADVIGVVTGIWWTASETYSVEVSWLHNGVSYSAWFPVWRLADLTKPRQVFHI